jgi:hypothetical protein
MRMDFDFHFYLGIISYGINILKGGVARMNIVVFATL